MAVVQTFRAISEFLSSMKCLGISSPKDLIIFMTKLVVSPRNWKFFPIYAGKIGLHVRTMWSRRVGPGRHVFTIMGSNLGNHSEKCSPTSFSGHFCLSSYPKQIHLISRCYSPQIITLCDLNLDRRFLLHTSSQFFSSCFWCDNKFWQHRVSTERVSASTIITLNTVSRTTVIMCTLWVAQACASDAHNSVWQKRRILENSVCASESGREKLGGWGSVS